MCLGREQAGFVTNKVSWIHTMLLHGFLRFRRLDFACLVRGAVIFVVCFAMVTLLLQQVAFIAISMDQHFHEDDGTIDMDPDITQSSKRIGRDVKVLPPGEYNVHHRENLTWHRSARHKRENSHVIGRRERSGSPVPRTIKSGSTNSWVSKSDKKTSEVAMTNSSTKPFHYSVKLNSSSQETNASGRNLSENISKIVRKTYQRKIRKNSRKNHLSRTPTTAKDTNKPTTHAHRRPQIHSNSTPVPGRLSRRPSNISWTHQVAALEVHNLEAKTDEEWEAKDDWIQNQLFPSKKS